MQKFCPRARLFVRCVAVFSLLLASVPALAVDRAWTPTGNASNNFATAGNWSPSGSPGTDDRAMITNNSVSVNETNIAYRDGDYSMFGHDTAGIVVSNSNTAGSGINKFLLNSGHFQMHQLVVGNNGIVEIHNNASLSSYRGATLSSGGTLFLNNGTFRMPGESRADLFVDGTVRVENNGTFVGGIGGSANSAFVIRNGGQLLVNSGNFFMNSSNAFSFGGFQIQSGGAATIASGASLFIVRTSAAWTGGNVPTNSGTIFMNGGSIQTRNTPGTAAARDRVIVNASGGAIRGSGTLDFTLVNNGVVEARSGQLTINNVTGAGGTWVSTNFGGSASTLTFGNPGGTSGAGFDLGGGTILNSNGAIRVQSGANVTLATSYRQNWGTIDFAGAAEIFLANSASAGALTNELVIRKTGTGASTLTTGFGAGQNNFPFINRGTISAGGGATLTINSENAFSIGFSNAASGRIEITSSTSQFQIKRTTAAWDGGSTVANVGTIAFTATGGTLSLLDVSTITPTRIMRNAGSIIASVTGGTPGNWWFNGTIINTAGGTLVVSNGTLNNLRFADDNAGIVRIDSANASLLLGDASFTNAGTLLMRGGTFSYANASGSEFQNLSSGVITGSGTILLGFGSGQNNFYIVNAGTVVASGGILSINSSNAFSGGGVSNVLGGTMRVESGSEMRLIRTDAAWDASDLRRNAVNAGTLDVAGGTYALYDSSGLGLGRFLRNTGTISGFGTISGSVTNFGTIIATNGTLRITGSGPFWQAGTLSIEQGGTLLLTNITTLSGVTFSNAGAILMRGGSLFAGVITNAGLIAGLGTIDGGGVFNGGTLLASNLTANVGTFTVRLTSFTNINGATIGTIGTQAVLNVRTPGAVNVLINEGTINISGGTITFNDGASGTITNFNTIGGVGNLATFPVVSVGDSSLIAQNPIPGLSNLVATVGITNSGLLAARHNATLELSVSTGTSIVNTNRMWMEGSTIVLHNGAGIVTNVNNGLIIGWGTLNAGVVNLSDGVILATNGMLTLGMRNNANAGLMSNLNSAASIRLTNSILVNTGTIALNGGALFLTGSTVTNQGTITGPGDSPSALFNDTTGIVIATNGTLHIATNASEFVENRGTFRIVSGGTLNVGPAVWNNLAGGLITNASGGVITRSAGAGVVTNAGVIINAGTFAVGVHNIANITNLTGHFTQSLTNAAGGVIVSSGGTFSGGMFANLGGTVVATNSKVTILNTAILNTGTIIGSPTAPVIITNITANMVNAGTLIVNGVGTGDSAASFDIMRVSGGSGDFTNAPGGMIIGAGYFKTADFTPGGRNFPVRNMGNIVATNGMLILQPGDAAAGGGFVNLGGTVTVANASALAIQRSDNAWSTSAAPRNEGLILLNGGTLVFFGNGLVVANDRALSNAPTGTIRGFGTLVTSLNNQGTLIVTNGTLFLDNAGATTQDGTIVIANNATFTVLGSAGSFQNNGTMLMTGGSFISTNTGPFRNVGTISGAGTIGTGRLSGTGGANQHIINLGTIISSSGTLVINPGDSFSNGGFSNAVSGYVRVDGGSFLILNRTANAWNNIGVAGNTNPRNLGVMEFAGGEMIIRSSGALALGRFIENFGTILGQGTISGSVTNFGTIAATNGTLAITGTGTFRQAGTLAVDTSGLLLLTNIVSGAGYSFTNEGSILMRGGELRAGVIANTNVIFGFGTISGGGVDNAGRLLASNGVLTAAISSFTNRSTATLGTLSTNATLDVTMPGGAGQPLINQGTIFMQGGTLLFNGLASGTITNTTTGFIKGVGLITQTVQNNGTILAAHPVSGLNVFSVGLSELNTATIGASNGAVLNVVLSGGAGTSFNNNGSISMIGGTLIISNGAPGVITNNAWVTGNGTVTPAIVNNSTIVATVNGGTLDVTMFGGTNTGWMRAGLGAVLQVQDGLINVGTIGANGAQGGTVMVAQATGIITNTGAGRISSDSSSGSSLTFASMVHNVNGGTMVATNGQLVFAHRDGLLNTNATIRISASGTLQSNSSNSWRNAGTIAMQGGTLRTGGTNDVAVAALFTNTATGVIAGYGTVIGGGAFGGSGVGFDKSIINLGTIIATNPLSGTAQTLYITTGGATASNGIQNLGTIIVSTNNTLSLNRGAGLPIVNLGTISMQAGLLTNDTGSGVLTNRGTITGRGTVSLRLVNAANGTIIATNGLLMLTATLPPVNLGTLQVANGATMTWNNTNSWQNLGTIDMRGGSMRLGGSTFVADPAPFTNLNYIVGYGTIIGGGSGNISGTGRDKTIMNFGTIIASGGHLILDTGFATLSNGIFNANTMIVSNSTDTLELRRAAEVEVGHLNYLINDGTIRIQGGTLTANSALTNRGTVTGYGFVSLTNELANLGMVRSTNGVLHFVSPTGAQVLQIAQVGTLSVELGSQMIFGTASNSPLRNSGTILMRGGILRSGTLTNQVAANFSGFGTITSPTIINAGTGMATSLKQALHLTGNTLYNANSGVFGANRGRLIVDGVFTNAGTVSFFRSIGTFNAAVVNQGAWLVDPSTITFNSDLTVGSSGYITMTMGDVFYFKSNFFNASTQANDYDTLQGKFVFDGEGGHTQLFYVAGLDLGGNSFQPIGTPSITNAFFGSGPIFGFSNNFALGHLEIGSLTTTSTLMLIDSFLTGSIGPDDGQVAGLYVRNFTIHPGSLLIVSNNVEFYFTRSNGITGVSIGTLNPGDNVLILNGGSFHQLQIVPEPSVLLLLVLGAVTIRWFRRRSRATVTNC